MAREPVAPVRAPQPNRGTPMRPVPSRPAPAPARPAPPRPAPSRPPEFAPGGPRLPRKPEGPPAIPGAEPPRGGGPTGPTGPESPVPTGGDDTGGGYTPFTPPPAAFSAIQIMENVLFAALGIRGLGAWAADLYNRGASPTEIIASLRYGTDTSEAGKAAYRSYLDAFPKMDQFLKDGIFAGENPEMQYIEYRNTVKEAGARYNVNQALMSNDKIADYISGRNSAAEIVNRMNMAAVAVAATPADTLGVLRDYYNVSNGDLMSFYLDTDATEAQLQQRYAAAQIGTEALRQQVETDKAFSEQLAMRGVTASEAEQGFGNVARQREFTTGRGETATQRELAQGAFGDQEMAKKIERIGASRVGAFQGGGGFIQGDRTGLGSAAT